VVRGAQVDRRAWDVILKKDIDNSSGNLETPDRNIGSGKIASLIFQSGIFSRPAFFLFKYLLGLVTAPSIVNRLKLGKPTDNQGKTRCKLHIASLQSFRWR
jgi:hypothetical protein